MLKDMLRASVIDVDGYWDKFLSLCKFLYHNSYHSSVNIDPFETFYGEGIDHP